MKAKNNICAVREGYFSGLNCKVQSTITETCCQYTILEYLQNIIKNIPVNILQMKI